MGLAVARIAGQVVPGVEVARAWSAASARNGGEPVRTPLPVGWREGCPQAPRRCEGRKPLPGWQSDRLVVVMILLPGAVGRGAKGPACSWLCSFRQPAALGGASWMSRNLTAGAGPYREGRWTGSRSR